MRQLGLFCGTFNPIHLGHLLIAECARDQFQLDLVYFVTSPNPPHRTTGLLPAESRHELVSLAVADNPHFQASSLELKRPGPSYTADTVRDLINAAGEEVAVNLIIGGDNLLQLKSWHDSSYLLSTCRFLVAPRTIYENDAQSARNPAEAEALPAVEPIYKVGSAASYKLPGAQVAVIDFPHIAISSSAVRARLKRGQSVLYMVPPAVNQALLQRRFYL